MREHPPLVSRRDLLGLLAAGAGFSVGVTIENPRRFLTFVPALT